MALEASLSIKMDWIGHFLKDNRESPYHTKCYNFKTGFEFLFRRWKLSKIMEGNIAVRERGYHINSRDLIGRTEGKVVTGVTRTPPNLPLQCPVLRRCRFTSIGWQWTWTTETSDDMTRDNNVFSWQCIHHVHIFKSAWFVQKYLQLWMLQQFLFSAFVHIHLPHLQI